VFQTSQIFRNLVLPALKKVTERAAEISIPTHVHSCGPEKELVKMAGLYYQQATSADGIHLIKIFLQWLIQQEPTEGTKICLNFLFFLKI
jgi:hypothetical protein